MYYLLTCLHICLCFFPAQTHISGEKALFYSYHVLITEVCWMLLLFDVIKLKGKRPVTCDTDSFSLDITKSRSVWSLVKWIYIYIPGTSKKVGMAKTLSIRFCADAWGLQSLGIQWFDFELPHLKTHAHPSF